MEKKKSNYPKRNKGGVQLSDNYQKAYEDTYDKLYKTFQATGQKYVGGIASQVKKTIATALRQNTNRVRGITAGAKSPSAIAALKKIGNMKMLTTDELKGPIYNKKTGKLPIESLTKGKSKKRRTTA